MSTYESDFFSHGEEELECWSFLHLCCCHHRCYADTVIRSERGLISEEHAITLNNGDSFLIPVMAFL